MPECQRTLIAMKNAGWSYQMIADSLANGGNTISPALVNKVANGECNSARIEAALGLAEEMVTVPKSLVRIRPRSKTPRGKRQRLNIEDPTGDITEQNDAICAAEGMNRSQLQRLMQRNHIEYHGTRDYAELEY